MERHGAEGLEALLGEVAKGSEAALERLYRSVHGRVYAFALRRLGDPVEAADVVNEVMLEVWRHAPKFEGRSKALTWIFGIAHHKVMDSFRGRDRAEATETLPEIIDENVDLHGALAGMENAEWLRHCLERLSDAHRSVIHLTFFEDLSYPEIANIVDCPVGTIKTRMFHAKRSLKDCLSALLGENACSA